MWGLLLGLGACQDYPFETRETRRVEAARIQELVATVSPTDILFVIDNSGSMGDEIDRLRNNVQAFIEELSESATDYQVGFIAPDVACNLPACGAVAAGAPCRDCSPTGETSPYCTAACTNPCEDRDTDGDLEIDFSTCDGGRLRAVEGRAPIGGNPAGPIFKRPSAAGLDTWLQEVRDTINTIACDGTPFEAGFEAVRRAVACGLERAPGEPPSAQCPDAKVAELNRGFIRDNADLVIIFISDEDDCSFRRDPSNPGSFAYNRVSNVSSGSEQQTKLCNPEACYAHVGITLSTCQQVNPSISGFRSQPPPLPASIDGFIDDLVVLKGGDVTRVRAAAILGSVADNAASPQPDAVLGFVPRGCSGDQSATPTALCGCWSTGLGNDPTQDPVNFSPYCEVTSLTGGFQDRRPLRDSVVGACGVTPIGGCQALPGTRYMTFLSQLESRRQAAGKFNETLVDSICQLNYETTLANIVNSVILDTCLRLGRTINDPSTLQITYNGATLANVEPGSPFRGWSWRSEKPDEICLEGGLRKNINDTFELVILEPASTQAIINPQSEYN